MPGPGLFNGAVTDKGQDWLATFELWAQYRGINNRQKLAAMALQFRDNALTWYQILPEDQKDTFENLRASFVERYGQNQLAPWQRASHVWTMEQRPGEPVQDFVASMMKAAIAAGLNADQQLQAATKGLRPSIRQYVLRQQPATIQELLAAAILAERTDIPAATTSTDVIAETVVRLEKQLQQLTVAAFADRSRDEDRQPRRRYNDRSVSPPRPPPPPAASSRDVRHEPRSPSRYNHYSDRSTSRGERGVRFNDRLQANPSRRDFASHPPVCDGCGGDHLRYKCRFLNLRCYSCSRVGHKASVCRASQRGE